MTKISSVLTTIGKFLGLTKTPTKQEVGEESLGRMSGVEVVDLTTSNSQSVVQTTTDVDTEVPKTWEIKLPVGKLVKELPEGLAWPNYQDYLPEEVRGMIFDKFGEVDTTKLQQLPLMNYVTNVAEQNSIAGVIPYLRLSAEITGSLVYGGYVVSVYTLSLVIDPNSSEYPTNLTNFLQLGFGVRAKYSPATHVSGGVMNPAHFYLERDETYHSYRSLSQPSTAMEGAYVVTLGVLDQGPMWVTKKSFLDFYNNNEKFTERLTGRRLFGEYGQPNMSGCSDWGQQLQRLTSVDDHEMGFVILDLWLDENSPVVYKGNPQPPVTKIKGVVKPTGPKADLVRMHLENPGPTSHFAMRCISCATKRHGRLVHDINAVVTFDLVP